VDKHLHRENDTLKAAVTKAAELGLRFQTVTPANWARDTGLDAALLLKVAKTPVHYGVEIKQHLRPGTLGPLVQKLRTQTARPLLVANEVTKQLADALKTYGVEFIDTAGNAYVNEPPLLHVFVKGEKGGLRPPKDEPTRAFKPAGLQVIFALLARKGIETRPYREIAATAGVATGVVGNVMAELPKLGFLAEVKGTRRLVERGRLIDRWAEGYVRALRPKLLLGRFAGDLNLIRKAEPDPGRFVMGGETAAEAMTRHLRAATATVYADRVDAALVARLRLRADPQGNIDVRRRFWRFDGETQGLAPALLVYGDLLAIGDDRCIETAKVVREGFID
jgi:hypothetical protein